MIRWSILEEEQLEESHNKNFLQSVGIRPIFWKPRSERVALKAENWNKRQNYDEGATSKM